MLRSSIVAISWLVLTLPGCRHGPPTPPEDAQPSEPVTDEEPIEGDSDDIDEEKLGKDQLDEAKVMEPGPAETEVLTGKVPDEPDRASR